MARLKTDKKTNTRLNPGQKLQIQGLLRNWHKQGVLQSRIAQMVSHEGQMALLEQAFRAGSINVLGYARARMEMKNELIQDKIRASSFPAPHTPEHPKTPKECDQQYHSDAPECYPGLARAKSHIWGENGALFLRVRTIDQKHDPLLDGIGMHGFRIGHKEHECGFFDEVWSASIPRASIRQAKEKLDAIAKKLITEKEAGQGLDDMSTHEFIAMLENPDWKTDSQQSR